MYKANSFTAPAFSVMETIVAMLVTAIVMGLIFVIFTMVAERMIDYKKQNQLVGDMNRLTYSINKDIFDNEKMNSGDNTIVFSGYTGQIVKYEILPEQILRQSQSFTDTFQIKTFRFVIDTVQSASKRNIFRKLALQVEVNERPMSLSFYKRVYPNELLMTFKP